MGMTFNPMAVMMKQPGRTGVPYLGGGGSPPMPGPAQTGPNPNHVNPIFPGPAQGLGKSPKDAPSTYSPLPASLTLGPGSVRATGAGPFDPAYRQDLATYAGGLFARPGGNLSLNPTSTQPFGGAAVGGGNAPIFGMPNTMLQNALGGNPFSFTPPAPAQGAQNNQPDLNQLQAWLNQFMNQGRGLRFGNAQ